MELMDQEIVITQTTRKINAEHVCISDSTFHHVCAEHLTMNQVNMSGSKITDANLSDIEVDGAQLGGAYFHNIGLPMDHGHAYQPNQARQRPIRFENCDLNDTVFRDCDLSNVDIVDCNISGLRIQGILIEELLELALKK